MLLPDHKTRIARWSMLLLFLMLFQGVGWFLVRQALEWQAKAAASTAMQHVDTPLRKVTLDVRHFQKIRFDKHEICLDGNLYDVRSSTITGDSIALELYHDRREQALLALLGGSFTRFDAAGTPAPVTRWVAQWVSAVYLLPAPPAAIFGLSAPKKMGCFGWVFPVATPHPATPFQPPECRITQG
jgi:hypothetical protein